MRGTSEKSNLRGWFPETYVERSYEENECGLVLKDYEGGQVKGNLSDLKASKGQMVIILEQYSNGWTHCRLEGTIGLLPTALLLKFKLSELQPEHISLQTEESLNALIRCMSLADMKDFIHTPSKEYSSFLESLNIPQEKEKKKLH